MATREQRQTAIEHAAALVRSGVVRRAGADSKVNPHRHTLPQLAEYAGIEYRTAHVWMTRGLIHPSIQEANGQGHPAIFTDADCDTAMRLKALRDAGLSMDGLEAVVDNPAPLRRALEDWFDCEVGGPGEE